MARVLVLAGDAAEDLEVMYVKYRLSESGYDVHVAAPTRRPIKLVVHDFEPDWDAYVERPGRQCPVDVAFSECDPAVYVGVVIPGGRAPEYFASIQTCAASSSTSSRRRSRSVRCATVRRCLQRTVFCAGGAAPPYPPLAPDVELAGGTWVDEPDCVDGNLVSCPGWGDLAEWSRAYLDVLDRAAVLA